jgi:hypothetical protein
MGTEDYLAAIDRVVENGLTGDKVYDSLQLGAAMKGKAEVIHTSNKRDFDLFKPAIKISKVAI